MLMNNLSTTVKLLRKQYNLTQEELSLKSGVGLRFVRDLEQGKETLRLDKVNQLLDFFNYVWGIERSGFFNGREKWAKGFENQRV